MRRAGGARLTMLDVAVILPCKGRHEQTIRNAARLKSQAAWKAEWWAISGPEDARLVNYLQAEQEWKPLTVDPAPTYWQALKLASEYIVAKRAENLIAPPLFCAVANDLIPSPHWLKRGMDAYAARFGTEPGLMGFNGDGYGFDHSCHMLIHRDLLAQLGGWPVWYRHNYGDTELCLRAQQLDRYGKAPYAVLYHDHWRFGGGERDEVYAAGDATFDQDRVTFEQRRAEGGW